MKSIGRELTEKGSKEVNEMDSNGNGKIEEGEVKLGEHQPTGLRVGSFYEKCFRIFLILLRLSI